MFTTEYSFRGVYADKVKELTTLKFDKENTLFNRNMDVYLLAPIIGFLYQKRSPIDKSTNTTKIFAETLVQYQKEMEFAYRLVMLLDAEYEPDAQKRIDKAFKEYINPAQEDLARIDEYVRGGVDILYEKLVQQSSMPEDYLRNLYQFVEDCENRYGQNSQEILDLCRLAQN